MLFMNNSIEFAFLRVEGRIQLMEFLCPLIASVRAYLSENFSRRNFLPLAMQLI